MNELNEFIQLIIKGEAPSELTNDDLESVLRTDLKHACRKEIPHIMKVNRERVLRALTSYNYRFNYELLVWENPPKPKLKFKVEQ